MRRSHWGMLGGFMAMGSAAGFFWTMKSPAFQTADATLPLAAPAVAQGNAKLPIGKVALFSSGVGYFERAGTIDNDAIVELSFPSTDINDLLKSMMARDFGGGQVETVSLDSTAPLDKTLSSFAIDLQGKPGLGQILDQARGEKVEIVLSAGQGNANTRVSGTIIGLETQKEPVGANLPPIDREYLILNTEGGIRNLPVSQFVTTRFSDPTLEAELKKALDALGRARDSRKKTVALKFTGKGQRMAKVSYVTESPIWKTSYRLVLDDKENPTLLGWAVVENPTDDDWTNVKLSLVSGRPMSFRMDLWQSLYVDRPLVEPELFKSLRPVAYAGDMSKAKANRPEAGLPPGGGAGGFGGGLGGLGAGQLGGNVGGVGGLGGGGAGQLGGGISPSPGAASPGGNFFSAGDPGPMEKPESLTQGIKSIALAKELGQAFEHQIKNPISLGRRKSAMIPIIAAPVTADKVSIYNAEVHPKYPLLGLKLTNNTGGNLVQGPITVFEGGSYSGDGRIMDLEPNEKRILSYAVDLGVEVKTQTLRSGHHAAPEADPASAGHRWQDRDLVSLSISRGMAILKVRDRITTEYTIVNRSGKPRKLILEETIVQDGEDKWSLVDSPKPEETTAELYRFATTADAGKTAEIKIIQEKTKNESIKLLDMTIEQFQELAQKTTVNENLKDVLAKIQVLKNECKQTEVDRGAAEGKVAAIFQDQQRLRANLKDLPPTSAAYQRYLTKFDAQEPQLEKLQMELQILKQREAKDKQVFLNYLAKLEIK